VIAIGDVVGHSLRAATVMAEIRHALRAYALDGYGPGEVMERLDRMIQRFHPGMVTTAIYGVIDREAEVLEICNAGHLPPLLIASDARYLEAAGVMLGLGMPASEVQRVPIRAGDRLVLVTDGLIERRGETIDEGLERLRDACDRLREEDPESFVDTLLDEIGPGPFPADDIAILVIDAT
jgi:serine phosphatase RsbU (regulator of sigma subunit)